MSTLSQIAAYYAMSHSSSLQLEPPVENANANANADEHDNDNDGDSEVKGDQIVQWFEQLFEKSTTFASILAAVMFSAMILDFDNLRIPHGSHHEVRTWSATGAMLFVLLVLLCTGCSLVLKFYRGPITSGYDKKSAWVRYGFQYVSFLFQGLLLAGTLFFCLVVKAYVPAVGWTAFGITSICFIACLIIWVLQLKREGTTQRRVANG